MPCPAQFKNRDHKCDRGDLKSTEILKIGWEYLIDRSQSELKF